jgi:hypothetical protein
MSSAPYSVLVLCLCRPGISCFRRAKKVRHRRVFYIGRYLDSLFSCAEKICGLFAILARCGRLGLFQSTGMKDQKPKSGGRSSQLIGTSGSDDVSAITSREVAVAAFPVIIS